MAPRRLLLPPVLLVVLLLLLCAVAESTSKISRSKISSRHHRHHRHHTGAANVEIRAVPPANGVSAGDLPPAPPLSPHSQPFKYMSYARLLARDIQLYDERLEEERWCFEQPGCHGSCANCQGDDECTQDVGCIYDNEQTKCVPALLQPADLELPEDELEAKSSFRHSTLPQGLGFHTDKIAAFFARFYAYIHTYSKRGYNVGACFLMRYHPVFGPHDQADGGVSDKVLSGAYLNRNIRPNAFLMGLGGTLKAGAEGKSAFLADIFDEASQEVDPAHEFARVLAHPLPTATALISSGRKQKPFAEVVADLHRAFSSAASKKARPNYSAFMEMVPNHLGGIIASGLVEKALSIGGWESDGTTAVAHASLVSNLATLNRCIRVLQAIGYGLPDIQRDLSGYIDTLKTKGKSQSYFLTIVPQKVFLGSAHYTIDETLDEQATSLPRPVFIQGLRMSLSKGKLADYVVKERKSGCGTDFHSCSQCDATPDACSADVGCKLSDDPTPTCVLLEEARRYDTKLDAFQCRDAQWNLKEDRITVDTNERVTAALECAACEGTCGKALAALSADAAAQQVLAASWPKRFAAWKYVKAVPEYVLRWTGLVARLWQGNGSRKQISKNPYTLFVSFDKATGTFKRNPSPGDLSLDFQAWNSKWQVTNYDEFTTHMEACETLDDSAVELFMSAETALLNAARYTVDPTDAWDSMAMGVHGSRSHAMFGEVYDKTMYEGCVIDSSVNNGANSRALCMCRFMTLRRLFMTQLGLFQEFLGVGRTVLEKPVEDEDEKSTQFGSGTFKDENLKEYIVMNDQTLLDLKKSGAYLANLNCISDLSVLSALSPTDLKALERNGKTITRDRPDLPSNLAGDEEEESEEEQLAFGQSLADLFAPSPKSKKKRDLFGDESEEVFPRSPLPSPVRKQVLVGGGDGEDDLPGWHR